MLDYSIPLLILYINDKKKLYLDFRTSDKKDFKKIQH